MLKQIASKDAYNTENDIENEQDSTQKHVLLVTSIKINIRAN